MSSAIYETMELLGFIILGLTGWVAFLGHANLVVLGVLGIIGALLATIGVVKTSSFG